MFSPLGNGDWPHIVYIMDTVSKCDPVLHTVDISDQPDHVQYSLDQIVKCLEVLEMHQHYHGLKRKGRQDWLDIYSFWVSLVIRTCGLHQPCAYQLFPH